MFNYIIQFCIYHVHVFKFLSFLFNYPWHLFSVLLYSSITLITGRGILEKIRQDWFFIWQWYQAYLSCKFLSIRSCLLVFQIIVHVLERNTIFKLNNSLINWIISFMWVWIHFFSEQIEHQLDCHWVLI